MFEAEPQRTVRSATDKARDLELMRLASIWKEDPVRACATGNLTLSGRQVVDGVSLGPGDLCLAPAQTNAAECGIYEVRDGAWFPAEMQRHSDMVRKGTSVFVSEGTVNGGKVMQQGTLGVQLSITAAGVGTSSPAQSWAQFGGGGGGGSYVPIGGGTMTGALINNVSVTAPFFAQPTNPAATGGMRLSNGQGVMWRDAGNASDIGWSVGALNNMATTTNVFIGATGTKGTVEKLRVVSAPTTVDNAANAVFVASATSAKPLTVQGLASQAAVLTEWQASTGTAVASVSAAGLVTGVGFTSTGSATIQTGGAVIAGTLRSGSANIAASGLVRAANAELLAWRNFANGADVTLGVTAGDVLATSSTAFALGSAPASAGALRLSNNVVAVAVRNAAGTGDVSALTVDAANLITLGGGGQSGLVVGTNAASTGTTSIIGNTSVTITKGSASSWFNAAPTSTHALADSIFTATANTQKPLVIQALASQSAVLTEWQNSTGGTVLASVTSSGAFNATGITSLAGSAITTSGAVLAGTLRVGTTPAGSGALRMTNNEFATWRNAGNTADIIGLRVNANDKVIVGPAAPTTNDAAVDTFAAGSASTSRPFVVQYAPSQSAVGFIIQNSAGSTLFSVNAAGVLAASSGSHNFPGNVTTTTYNGTSTRIGTATTADALADSLFAVTATTQKALVLQAKASQTANPFEIQNSTGSGSLLFSVTSTGFATVGGQLTLGTLTGANCQLNFFTSTVNLALAAGGGLTTTTGTNGHVTTSTVTTANVLQVRGAASHTGDLQQWQSNTPTTLFAISAAGLPQWAASANEQTTVGAAGAASALPGQPTKYLKVKDSAGTVLVIPAYAS